MATTKFAIILTTLALAGFPVLQTASAGEKPIQSAKPINNSQYKVFDEVRFEISTSIQVDDDHENGVFLTPSLFLDPFESRGRQGLDKLFHPRFFLAANISTAGAASQLMAGASWKFPVYRKLFLDLGFGGALNNAERTGSTDSPNVGSHILFHEYATIGYSLKNDWNVTATVRHSSNANLAKKNSGLTYAGIGIGHAF